MKLSVALFASILLLPNLKSLSQTASAGIPCGGTTIIRADFESGLPPGWTVLDLDSAQPRPVSGLPRGWHSRVDYRDATDTVMINTSYYAPADTSDDWLITPQILLDTLSCISWQAYSLDPTYPESYELRISTTTPTPAGFFAHPPLLTESSLSSATRYYAVAADSFAGQQVYFAFRHTSYDRFVLVLDEFSVTIPAHRDASVYDLEHQSIFAKDTVEIKGTIANLGADTLDSVSVTWTINGSNPKTISLNGLALPPASSFSFTHDSLWYPQDTGLYSLCVFTSLPNGNADELPFNDSICRNLHLQWVIGMEEITAEKNYRIYPNPASGRMYFECDFYSEVTMLSADGRTVRKYYLNPGISQLDLTALSPGIYHLQIKDQKGAASVERIAITD